MANDIRRLKEVLERVKKDNENYAYFNDIILRYAEICPPDLFGIVFKRFHQNYIGTNNQMVFNAIKNDAYDVSVSLSFDKMLEIFDRTLPNEKSRIDRAKIIQDFTSKVVENIPFKNMICVDDGILSVTISKKEDVIAYAGYYNELVYKQSIIKNLWNDEGFIEHIRQKNIKKNWISREWIEDDSKCSALYHEIANLNRLIEITFKDSLVVRAKEFDDYSVGFEKETFTVDCSNIDDVISTALFNIEHLEKLIVDVCLEMKNAYVHKSYYTDPTQYKQYLKTKVLLTRCFDKVYSMSRGITKEMVVEYNKTKLKYAEGVKGKFSIL